MESGLYREHMFFISPTTRLLFFVVVFSGEFTHLDVCSECRGQTTGQRSTQQQLAAALPAAAAAAVVWGRGRGRECHPHQSRLCRCLDANTVAGMSRCPLEGQWVYLINNTLKSSGSVEGYHYYVLSHRVVSHFRPFWGAAVSSKYTGHSREDLLTNIN